MQVNLTQKEKMLLEDQKSHEEICIQKYSNYANQVQDPQLKQICKNNEQIERSHLNTINQLLSGNVPQMNQQQGGQQKQGDDQNVNKSQSTTSNLSDKEICSDLLMTEKYVSGAYDTAIFEFKDTEVRDVLNHIQKEEQKHGESIFKYMESKGMYNVQ
ncbi:spore coat protein [Clostridium beijerinckii]|uniref:Spore coat protein n=1 Tax=Clostridium beijerinckii TaxID=1520 RepID=A0AB74VA56_CLOBE|nr:spore coat protein [Clostridium beijerinckii]NRZ27478.1 spore coat protein CotF [Clostridium beijerinckii]NYB96733.1 spore coat protein CotF [Clostridium beijerinckii]OOM26121.1 coat F domain protein [Clostridium beijerinckii]QUN33304.1 spore coat protein [Clostridium beijerinckii]SQB19955.1 Spore coat protein [Clostridium beijerinckii]